MIKCSSGPKLPSNHQNAFPTDIPLEFEVNFKDPYNLITGVSTDWKFGDGSKSVLRWCKRTISHTFHKEGKYCITVRVNTKFLGKKSFSVKGISMWKVGRCASQFLQCKFFFLCNCISIKCKSLEIFQTLLPVWVINLLSLPLVHCRSESLHFC